MKSFKELTEETKAVAENGTALSNHLVKHFDGEKHKNMLGSNPYADYKHTDLSVHKSRTEDLKKHLESHGWKSHTRNLNDSGIKNGTFHMEHPTNKDVHLTVSPNKGTLNHDHLTHVRIYSPKKAKRSNLPYYD